MTDICSGIDAPDGTFAIPHSITADEKRNVLYVADRENGRIQSFDFNGHFVKKILQKEFVPTMYAVSYSRAAGN